MPIGEPASLQKNVAICARVVTLLGEKMPGAVPLVMVGLAQATAAA